MRREQGDDSASNQTPEPVVSGSANAVATPFILSVFVLAYYLGVGLIVPSLLGMFPNLKLYFSELAIALLLQFTYGIGAVGLVFWLSISRPFLAWLAQCGLRQTKAGLVLHGFIIGVGLQVIPWVVFEGDGKPADERVSTGAFLSATILFMPLLEDVVFQGFLYPVYRRRFGVSLSIVFLSLVTVAAHSLVITPHLYLILAVFFSEMIFCLYREYTLSLWPTTACHFANNAASLWTSS